jgi:lipoate---protein ligase
VGGARYELSRWRGSAAEFHARSVDAPVTPAVWVFDVTAPALVLGSAQPWAAADAAACAAAGVDVVRRRSGGGAVLLEPGAIVWFDVVVPAALLLRAGVGVDVARSMTWLGQAIDAALASLGVAGTAVHAGPMVTTPWSRAVCFDGVGPGEVVAPSGKLVGISQRRTRAGARFQCAAHTRWSPERVVALLSPPRPTAAELAPVATLPARVAPGLAAAVATTLSA